MVSCNVEEQVVVTLSHLPEADGLRLWKIEKQQSETTSPSMHWSTKIKEA